MFDFFLHFSNDNSIVFLTVFSMKWYCLLLALGLLQVSVFLNTVDAASDDFDGDGVDDDSKFILYGILGID